MSDSLIRYFVFDDKFYDQKSPLLSIPIAPMGKYLEVTVEIPNFFHYVKINRKSTVHVRGIIVGDGGPTFKRWNKLFKNLSNYDISARRKY